MLKTSEFKNKCAKRKREWGSLGAKSKEDLKTPPMTVTQRAGPRAWLQPTQGQDSPGLTRHSKTGGIDLLVTPKAEKRFHWSRGTARKYAGYLRTGDTAYERSKPGAQPCRGRRPKATRSSCRPTRMSLEQENPPRVLKKQMSLLSVGRFLQPRIQRDHLNNHPSETNP